MRIQRAVLLGAVLSLVTACDDFLDVNDNPNAPQTVSPNLYLSPMLHWMVTAPQFDGRFVVRYTQQLSVPANPLTTWDRMGYDPSSDNGAQQWRDVYWSFGQNLVDMMRLSEETERWDLLGVGYILKAWGWQALTDLHGEIIIKEAFDASKFSFNYDTQQFAYEEIRRLLDDRSDATLELSVEQGGKAQALRATHLQLGRALQAVGQTQEAETHFAEADLAHLFRCRSRRRGLSSGHGVAAAGEQERPSQNDERADNASMPHACLQATAMRIRIATDRQSPRCAACR